MIDLHDDPTWNADVLESYCFLSFRRPTPGDFLRDTLIQGTPAIFCQNDARNAEAYQAPPFTEEEFDAWSAAITEFAPACASRTSDVNAGEVVDLTDVLCVLDGFAGQFTTCSLESLDIGNCTPDAPIDLSDILAVLDAFRGQDPCCNN